jgi:hypothetical protein
MITASIFSKEDRWMSETPSRQKILLARFVIILITAFVILGVLRYGFSPGSRQRFWQDLLARPGGPMTFRFILQPVMALIAAVHDGLQDARTGRPPYLWTILTNPAARKGQLYEGLIATSRIILLGLVMDMIYQFIVLKSFYPGQAVVVALALAFVPYVLLRGPTLHLARLWRGQASPQGHPHDR